MGNCAIVGINWGDEGKGRMVDLLTQDYDVVVRYQGGGNAGHTVINEYGKFALHLLPSGIFRKGVVNILGNGVALDPENLWKEIEQITSQGVSITPENLKISDRASLLLPWHRLLDGLEEARLADKKFGSTRQGIAPFYYDKYQKKTVLAGELLYNPNLRQHLAELLEWKNLTINGVYGAEPVTMAELEAWLNDYCEKIKPFICDTGAFLRDAQKQGKKILFEAHLGALRDLDYGIFPYTTSSNSIAAYAPVGSGLPSAKLFTHLDQIREGDLFLLRVLDETLTYEVDQILIVEPHEVEALAIEPGMDYCTLVTCTPYGINSHRLLVRGHRVENQASAASIRVTADAMQIEPVIVAPVVAVPMLLVLLVWLLIHDRKRKPSR